MRTLASAVLVMTLLLTARVALACSWLPHEKLLIEADPADVTPPSAVQTDVSTNRNPKESAGCGKQHVNSCHGIASLRIGVQASDDTTEASQLGYLIELVDGDDVDFSNGDLPPEPVLARSGSIYVHWNDGDGRDEVDFELDVWTVDRAGNMSEQPTRVSVHLPATRQGCSAMHSGSGLPWLVVAVAYLWRRRRS